VFSRLGLALIFILAATALPPPPLPVLPRAGEASGLGMEDPGGVDLPDQAETLEGDAAGGPCACPPRPREAWAVGLGHFYGDAEGRDGYAWRMMANGQPMNPQALTIAVRVDYLALMPLGSTVRISSYCGVVIAIIADTMPLEPAMSMGVIIDVSPAIAGKLFCEGYGHNGKGIAYGEELVLVEVIKD